jgi:hypothetical protein
VDGRTEIELAGGIFEVPGASFHFHLYATFPLATGYLESVGGRESERALTFFCGEFESEWTKSNCQQSSLSVRAFGPNQREKYRLGSSGNQEEVFGAGIIATR